MPFLLACSVVDLDPIPYISGPSGSRSGSVQIMMELDRDPGGPKTYRPGSATLNYSKNEKASIPPCGTMSIDIFALLTLVLLSILSSIPAGGGCFFPM
jgi:hypothetical protein